MSQGQSDSRAGDKAPLIPEIHFDTVLHISEPGDDCYQSPPPQDPQQEDEVDKTVVPQTVVLSTQSPAALKTGTHQLIPKNLATTIRSKHRHHTTVVTFPIGLEHSSTRTRHSAQGSDVSWEDYDSDGDGFALRRNRRNKSYRAAVTSLDIEAMAGEKGSASTLKPVKESRAPSPNPGRSPLRKVASSDLHVVLLSSTSSNSMTKSDCLLNVAFKDFKKYQCCRHWPNQYRTVSALLVHSTQLWLLFCFLCREPLGGRGTRTSVGPSRMVCVLMFWPVCFR